MKRLMLQKHERREGMREQLYDLSPEEARFIVATLAELVTRYPKRRHDAETPMTALEIVSGLRQSWAMYVQEGAELPS